VGSSDLRGHWKLYIKHKRPCLTTFSNTEKRIENMMQREVFLMNFEMSRNVFDVSFESLLDIFSKLTK